MRLHGKKLGKVIDTKRALAYDQALEYTMGKVLFLPIDPSQCLFVCFIQCNG
jgi:hypothetical protein